MDARRSDVKRTQLLKLIRHLKRYYAGYLVYPSPRYNVVKFPWRCMAVLAFRPQGLSPRGLYGKTHQNTGRRRLLMLTDSVPYPYTDRLRMITTPCQCYRAAPAQDDRQPTYAQHMWMLNMFRASRESSRFANGLGD